MTTTPHDALFKAIFAVPQDAAGLLRPLLPAPVADAIDWSTLRPAHGSFVDDALRHLHSDLLFDVKLRGRAALLYLLAEHKSDGDRFTALQLLRYVARIWARWHEEHPNARHLPHIIPLVIHHGERPWREPCSLRELLDMRGLDADTAAALASCAPDFHFVVDDVTTADDDAIRRREVSAVAQLALVCMRSLRLAGPDAAVELLARWLDAVTRALATPGGADRITVVWSYILRVTDLSPQRLRPIVAAAGPDAEATLMSTADRLHAEGRAKGKAEGKAEILLRQLTKRFGPVAPHVLARVRVASIADLDRWADEVLTAPTLDAVFADS